MKTVKMKIVLREYQMMNFVGNCLWSYKGNNITAIVFILYFA